MPATRIAIVGYGVVADIHARVIRSIPNVELVAVIGPRDEPARHFAERHGIRGVFNDLAQALHAARPYAVIVASPTDLHLAHARRAIEAGVHALIEFPLVAPREELEALFADAARRNLILAVAHTSRFIWSFERARTILQSGRLGGVKAANFVRMMNRPAGTGADGASRTWNDDVLLHHACHVLDVYRFWFGDRIILIGAVSPGEDAGRRNVGLLLAGPEHQPLCALLSYDAPSPMLHVHLVACNGELRIDGFSRLSVCGEEDASNRPDDEEGGYHEAIGKQDRAFMDAVRGRNDFSVAPAETIALSDLTSQACASCRAASSSLQ